MEDPAIDDRGIIGQCIVSVSGRYGEKPPGISILDDCAQNEGVAIYNHCQDNEDHHYERDHHDEIAHYIQELAPVK